MFQIWVNLLPALFQQCKKAKLQARMKPTALCSVIDKENSIKSLLDLLHYIYNYCCGYIPCLPQSSCPSADFFVTCCDHGLWLCDFVTCHMIFPLLHLSCFAKSWQTISMNPTSISANAWRALILALMGGHMYWEAARIDVIKFHFPASCSHPILTLYKFGHEPQNLYWQSHHKLVYATYI